MAQVSQKRLAAMLGHEEAVDKTKLGDTLVFAYTNSTLLNSDIERIKRHGWEPCGFNPDLGRVDFKEA